MNLIVSVFVIAGLLFGSGATVAAAQDALQKMYGGSTQINLRPVWWPWLPLLPFRISVTPSL